MERDRDWFEARRPILEGRIRTRLAQARDAFRGAPSDDEVCRALIERAHAEGGDHEASAHGVEAGGVVMIAVDVGDEHEVGLRPGQVGLRGRVDPHDLVGDLEAQGGVVDGVDLHDAGAGREGVVGGRGGR